MSTVFWRQQTDPLSGRLRKKPRPQIVVALLLVAGAFPARFAIGGASLSLSLFDVAMALAFVPFFLTIAVHGLPKIHSSFVVLALVSICLSIASIFWSQERGSTLIYVASSIEALLVLLVVASMLRDAPPRQIANLISGMILLLLIAPVLLWLKVPGFLPPSELSVTSGDYISYFTRLSHPFIGRSNNLAALLVIFIVPLFVWAIKTRHLFAGLAAFAALAAVLLTVSRGTLLALIASVLLYVVVDSRSARRFIGRLLVPLLFAGTVAITILSLNDATVAHFASRFTSAGIDARNVLLDDATAEIVENWALGLGAGVGPDVHNTFVQQIVYFGLIGGLTLSIMIIRIMMLWFAPRGDDSMRWLVHAIGIGFAAQLISFLFESSYEGTLLRPLIWLGWGLLMAWMNSIDAYGRAFGPETLATRATHTTNSSMRSETGVKVVLR